MKNDDKVTRRDFLTKIGKWSPVVAGLVYGVSLGAGAVSSGCSHYSDYANYSDYSNYANTPLTSYCNGCRRNYVLNLPPGSYCNYLNYTDGCY